MKHIQMLHYDSRSALDVVIVAGGIVNIILTLLSIVFEIGVADHMIHKFVTLAKPSHEKKYTEYSKQPSEAKNVGIMNIFICKFMIMKQKKETEKQQQQHHKQTTQWMFASKQFDFAMCKDGIFYLIGLIALYLRKIKMAFTLSIINKLIIGCFNINIGLKQLICIIIELLEYILNLKTLCYRYCRMWINYVTDEMCGAILKRIINLFKCKYTFSGMFVKCWMKKVQQTNCFWTYCIIETLTSMIRRRNLRSFNSINSMYLIYVWFNDSIFSNDTVNCSIRSIIKRKFQLTRTSTDSTNTIYLVYIASCQCCVTCCGYLIFTMSNGNPFAKYAANIVDLVKCLCIFNAGYCKKMMPKMIQSNIYLWFTWYIMNRKYLNHLFYVVFALASILTSVLILFLSQQAMSIISIRPNDCLFHLATCSLIITKFSYNKKVIKYKQKQ